MKFSILLSVLSIVGMSYAETVTSNSTTTTKTETKTTTTVVTKTTTSNTESTNRSVPVMDCNLETDCGIPNFPNINECEVLKDIFSNVTDQDWNKNYDDCCSKSVFVCNEDEKIEQMYVFLFFYFIL